MGSPRSGCAPADFHNYRDTTMTGLYREWARVFKPGGDIDFDGSNVHVFRKKVGLSTAPRAGPATSSHITPTSNGPGEEAPSRGSGSKTQVLARVHFRAEEEDFHDASPTRCHFTPTSGTRC